MDVKNQPGKIVSLGLQHMLAMYAGAVVVPLIVGSAIGLKGAMLAYLVSIDLAACGLATLLQVWKNRFFGIGLPVVLGCTFTAVTPMIVIGKKYGIEGVCGSIIGAGIILFGLSFILGKIVKFVSPVVIGSVVVIIGLTLIPVAVNNVGGGVGAPNFGDPKNLLLAFGVLLLIVLMNRLFTGFLRSISILLGIIIGTIAASFMGMVDFTSVGEAHWFQILKPFSFGAPTFHIDAIITMTIVVLVSLIESTGVYFALSKICHVPINNKLMEKGYRAESLAVVVGGLFNAFPYTTFSQNLGLVQMTKVKSRSVIVVCGVILIVVGFIPKIGVITTIIPSAVLGGAMIAMFGMVVSAGIKMLSEIDFSKNENLLIIACSVGLGLGVTVQPQLFSKLPSYIQIVTNNGVVAGALMAIILQIIFNFNKSKLDEKDINEEKQDAQII
ncbi:purine permease [Terrilactibacillus sp. BCM23-1]|uniref:Purine permease n=1 Tax=Terrilactibacillus tamarindi TaxID=2599694 RepID=A0A6N8CU64_9BACI|nr:nucleobase:cation symporter-2 family protein [Terrilactibacillus tamarindi]MTT33330.1 purine permease [Terrilactibacillus tamarindi]